MKTQAALALFDGPKKLSVVLTVDGWWITSSAISQWGVYPPRGRQFQIQAITNGRLVAEVGK